MAYNQKNGKSEELSGQWEKQSYMNDDTGWMFGFLRSGEKVSGTPGERKLIPGVEYRFMGVWKDGGPYGREFKYSTFIQVEPHTRHGVVEYLKKYAPGVGDVIAHRLCDIFGENECISVLKRDPARVAANVPHLGVEKALEASEALIKEEKFEQTRVDLLDLFAGKGFPSGLSDCCIDKWGIHAAKRVQRDPFCLLSEDMPGCGFLRVDRLYLELGNDPQRLSRRMYCAWFAVQEDRTGSVWVTWKSVKDDVEKLITNCNRIDIAIDIAVGAGWLDRESVEGEVYLAEHKQAFYESNIVERLKVLT